MRNQVAIELIDFKLNTDHKLLELEEQFVKDLKNIISPLKIVKLQIVEMEFGRKLMRRYRGGKGNGNNKN